ncbi:MAG: hypothetical protein ACHQU0_00300 [Candidatus Paceibacteria bacterium]
MNLPMRPTDLNLDSSEEEILNFCQRVPVFPQVLPEQKDMYLRYGMSLLELKKQRQLFEENQKLTRHTRNLSYATVILAVGTIIATLTSYGAFITQNETLQASNKIDSARYVLKVSDEIGRSQYTNIINAIENNTSAFPLLLKGFNQNDIEGYIGNFETLGDLSRDGIIDPSMANDELGYDLEKTWCNVDVQKIIKKDRVKDGTLLGKESFYNGFETLAIYSLNQDGKSCSDMDKE